MRNFRNIFAVFAAFFVFSTVNASAQNFTDSGRRVTALEQQVLKEITKLPRYGVFDHIAFEVLPGNRVVLYGKVISLGTRKSAERVVSRVPGVQSVENRITDLPPSPFDDRIRRGIVQNFVNSAGLYPYLREPRPSVRIVVENGRVTLEGYVNNRSTSNLMYMLANQVFGVFEVRNNLVIDNGRDR
ncbi:MAG: BON domain-containing protein [Acidobacteriota bacterium]